MAVIDVSDPTKPGKPFYQETDGPAGKIWVEGNYAYLSMASSMFSGIAIIDVSDPKNLGNKPNAIPMGNFFLIFMLVGVVVLVYKRKKV